MTRSRARTAAILLLAFTLTAGCDTQDSPATPPSAQPPASTALTEDAIKRFITRKEENLATGVGSAHKSVALDFLEIRLGDPRKPNEQDKIDGVRGDTVHPVRAKYKSTRKWGNGDTDEKTIHYNYDFYKDEFGDWNAILRGPLN
jgi:hypothetical protein